MSKLFARFSSPLCWFQGTLTVSWHILHGNEEREREECHVDMWFTSLKSHFLGKGSPGMFHQTYLLLHNQRGWSRHSTPELSRGEWGLVLKCRQQEPYFSQTSHGPLSRSQLLLNVFITDSNPNSWVFLSPPPSCWGSPGLSPFHCLRSCLSFLTVGRRPTEMAVYFRYAKRGCHKLKFE